MEVLKNYFVLPYIRETKGRTCHKILVKNYFLYAVALLWLKWAGLFPAVLGPGILSMGVETGPTATQLGSACAQTMPRQMGCGRQI